MEHATTAMNPKRIFSRAEVLSWALLVAFLCVMAGECPSVQDNYPKGSFARLRIHGSKVQITGVSNHPSKYGHYARVMTATGPQELFFLNEELEPVGIKSEKQD